MKIDTRTRAGYKGLQLWKQVKMKRTIRDKIIRMVPFTFAMLSAVASMLGAGCRNAVEETKLLGSWQVDAPLPTAVIFTYASNHIVTMTFTGSRKLNGYVVVGTWRLHGDLLTTSISTATNANVALPPQAFPFNQERTHITKLSESVMVWKNSSYGSGIRLRRLNKAGG